VSTAESETPFSLLEKEHVFEIQIAAVLSPPCLKPNAPWECHNWVSGSLVRNTTGPRLNGTVVTRIDILSGQAVFTDLAIVDAPPGFYKILFYVANSTMAHFQGRTSLNLGMQLPGIHAKFLATDSWPVLETTIHHTMDSSVCARNDSTYNVSLSQQTC